MSPGSVVPLLARWKGRLAGCLNLLGYRTPPQLHAGGVGRQQQLTQYYRSNSLLANPDKTQVTAFHLRNKEANRSLKLE